MTGRTSSASRTKTMAEVRVMLPAVAHEDLLQMATVSGLAASQYLRTLFMTHRAKMYATDEKNG